MLLSCFFCCVSMLWSFVENPARLGRLLSGEDWGAGLRRTGGRAHHRPRRRRQRRPTSLPAPAAHRGTRLFPSPRAAEALVRRAEEGPPGIPADGWGVTLKLETFAGNRCIFSLSAAPNENEKQHVRAWFCAPRKRFQWLLIDQDDEVADQSSRQASSRQ